MSRYARQPELTDDGGHWLADAISGLGAMIARNPGIAGGTTAFIVSLAFVSANAIWYQPQSHPRPMISTRQVPAVLPRQAPLPPEPVRPEASAPQSAPQPVSAGMGDQNVFAVQKVLAALGVYQGPVDGMNGPQTRAAVEKYKSVVGLSADGNIDAALLRQLGIAEQPRQVAAAPVTSPAPAPKPRPRPAPREDVLVASAQIADSGDTAHLHTASVPANEEIIRKVQAGLRSFGNDGMEIDGVMGERTRSAIREFQSLFGLTETGEPDAEFIAKMKEVGLIN